ncbi:prolyl oligopeptidase family serine peptidase [Flavobacterium sp. Sd200]|uniref:alpha/beta hydrolase n=1 Tax=Flavobacterium sp. Sd200 TaxID=2692211 RepID=UPI00136A462E|nr:alpha/beta hydrolase [Flavobacterium sp. Sd200]MXN92332.1 prolyl oligopeptidase family serine peptidase [Flavobacterium sp. Sd200]
MKKTVTLLLLFISVIVSAQNSIPLWPKGKMPNSKGLKLVDIEERERITQVSAPRMLAFFPAKEEQNGSSILIIPGGGYQKLTYNLGGIQLAKWFNTQGITAFVLIYRLPNSPDLLISENGPIQDAQRALKLIRSNAAEWNLDGNKVGVFGSSAGGHLASVIGTHNNDLSKINDTVDANWFLPNFMVLVSPVISFGEYAHKGSLENFLGNHASPDKIKEYSNEFQVTDKTPQTILFHAQNDVVVSPMNSVLFYEQMIKHGVKGSLHIFPKGMHSIGIYNESSLTDEWKIICTKWLKEIEIVK